ADAGLEVGAQLDERVEAARLAGEVVVELGQPLLLDLLDRRREDRLLAGELLVVEVVREAHAHLALLAGGGARQLLLESLEQLSRSELQEVAARLAALERLAVDRPGEVEHHEVAFARRAFDGLE